MGADKTMKDWSRVDVIGTVGELRAALVNIPSNTKVVTSSLDEIRGKRQVSVGALVHVVNRTVEGYPVCFLMSVVTETEDGTIFDETATE